MVRLDAAQAWLRLTQLELVSSASWAGPCFGCCPALLLRLLQAIGLELLSSKLAQLRESLDWQGCLPPPMRPACPLESPLAESVLQGGCYLQEPFVPKLAVSDFVAACQLVEQGILLDAVEPNSV